MGEDMLRNLIACTEEEKEGHQNVGPICYVEKHMPPREYFRAAQVVEKVKNEIEIQAGSKIDDFKMHHFIKVWQTLKAKENLEYGRFVTDQHKEWVWNNKWVKTVKQIVLRYLMGKKNQKIDIQLNPSQEKALKNLKKK